MGAGTGAVAETPEARVPAGVNLLNNQILVRSYENEEGAMRWF